MYRTINLCAGISMGFWPVLMTALIIGLGVSDGQATNTWLSPSDVSSAPPADPSEIPEFQRSGTLYVWGQVDPEQTLWNWTLNIHTGNPGAINFTGVNLLNPKLGETDDGTREFRRYVVPLSSTLQADGQALEGFGGQQIPSVPVIGVGLGPVTQPVDPCYDDVNNSWLLAEITYDKAGTDSTDIWLQIGRDGLNSRGQRREETDVVFGALTDPALNGDTGREQDSMTPEGHIVPEPSAVFLATIGLIALWMYVPKRKRRWTRVITTNTSCRDKTR